MLANSSSDIFAGILPSKSSGPRYKFLGFQM